MRAHLHSFAGKSKKKKKRAIKALQTPFYCLLLRDINKSITKETRSKEHSLMRMDCRDAELLQSQATNSSANVT